MEYIDPGEIEKRSMEIIEKKMGKISAAPEEKKIIKRVIHATADTDFSEKIVISSEAVITAKRIFKKGYNLVTDVNMLKSGISKKKIKELGIMVKCFIGREDIAAEASAKGITRSMMSMRKAITDKKNKMFIIGNAPTALFELINLIKSGKGEQVEMIIGTPVGFVGASEAKEELQKLNLPYITVTGKKGGSAVAASITNALLYML
ncbi:MAG: precorrin-8X methylmutase [Bacillota bacterium]